MQRRPSPKERLRAAALRLLFLVALALVPLAILPRFAQAQSPLASATASAPGLASAAPSSSAAKSDVPSDTFVRIRDKKVFEIKVPRAGVSAADRARAATRSLEAATAESEDEETRVEEQNDVAIIFVGKSPVVQLGVDDATAAGDVSLSVHAGTVEAKIKDAISGEQKRRAAANTVFSISLLVFSGLIALLLIRKLGELVERARAWVAANPDRAPTLRAFGIDIFSPHIFRGGLSVTLGAAKLLVQIGVGYGWVLIALSLFESTRSYTALLTKAVVGPLTGLTQRLAESVPILVVGAVSIFALFVITRFIGLFFRSVSRGDAELGWLPSDLAIPTSVLVRAGILVFALVLGIPIVTGSSEGSLARAGVLVLAALGLATTPLLATGAMGVIVIYGRRLRIGDIADVGGRSGRITGIDLLEVRLEDEHGFEVRVPHLLALIFPTRVLGRTRIARVLITVSTTADQAAVRTILTEAAQKLGQSAKVDMDHFDANGVRYEVSCRMGKKDARAELLSEVATALLDAKIPLGVQTGSASPP